MVKRRILGLLAAAVFLFCCGCNPVDSLYGQPEPETAKETVSMPEIPVIRSSDTVMPLYFDISLFDEENYSEVFLGKKYKFRMTYAGSELTVPTNYKEMTKKGWEIAETSAYQEDSILLAGETVRVAFANQYGKQIDAQFYNVSDSSAKLTKCKIVKLIVAENTLFVKDSSCDQFWINGVTNQAALTDVIEYLGTPSHFYSVTPNEYYLDYFLTAENRRTGITVYVSVENDCVNSIEMFDYR